MRSQRARDRPTGSGGTLQIVFETHSISEDNERGIATGWLPGRLSPRGRALARELGARRHDDGLAAVFSSDLTRAYETAGIAFADTGIPIFLDWRLRECNYGDFNGTPVHLLHVQRVAHLDTPYPNGESWKTALARVLGVLPDLRSRWPDARVLLIGHVATRWALDHALTGARLEDLARADFAWQPGWEYEWDGRPLTD